MGVGRCRACGRGQAAGRGEAHLLKAPALRSVNSAIVFLRLALLAAFLAWRNMGSLTLSTLVTLDLSTVGKLLGAGTFRELGRDEMEALLGSTSGSRDGYDCRAGAPSGRSSSSPPEGGGFFMGFSKTIMSGVEVWKAPLSPVALSWGSSEGCTRGWGGW